MVAGACAIVDKLAELGGGLWALALEMANNRLSAEREALEAERQEVKAAWQEAANLADQLTGDLDAAQARITAVEAAEAQAKADAEALRGKLAATNEKVINRRGPRRRAAHGARPRASGNP